MKDIIDRMREHQSNVGGDSPYDERGEHFGKFIDDTLAIVDAFLAEHDPTPMRPEHFRGKLEYEFPGNRYLILESWDDDSCHAFFREPANSGNSYYYVTLMELKTVGQYRTFLRAFGIEVGG